MSLLYHVNMYLEFLILACTIYILASDYYHIGENKLRIIAEEHPEADFIIMNGNRILIKRQKFEEFLDNATVV